MHFVGLTCWVDWGLQVEDGRARWALLCPIWPCILEQAVWVYSHGGCRVLREEAKMCCCFFKLLLMSSLQTSH